MMGSLICLGIFAYVGAFCGVMAVLALNFRERMRR